MKTAIPLLTLVTLMVGIMAVPSAAQQTPRSLVVEQVEVGPPIIVTDMGPNTPGPGAVPIRFNGSFDDDPADRDWILDSRSIIRDEPRIDGTHSMRQGWQENEHALAINLLSDVDFSQYAEPIWLHICVQMATDHMFTDLAWDVCSGGLYSNSGQFIAALWEFSNLDVQMPPEWVCHWYRIENLTLWGNNVNLVLASDNDPIWITSCTYDAMIFYGRGRYRSFVTTVVR